METPWKHNKLDTSSSASSRSKKSRTMILFSRWRALAPQYWLRQVLPLLATVTASLSAPAFAADLAAPPSPFTWTGLYVGANGGAWFAPANPSYEAIGFPSAGFDLVPNGGGESAGFTGGFQAGYNYQIGSLVPGFETDFNYLGNCRSGCSWRASL
jgi:outer membrane immunogenic protein